MTKKQIKTLILFSQNYSVETIAHKLTVSHSTIKTRLNAISRNYKAEFANVLGVRESYKRIRDGIRNPKRFGGTINTSECAYHPRKIKGVDTDISRIHELF